MPRCRQARAPNLPRHPSTRTRSREPRYRIRISLACTGTLSAACHSLAKAHPGAHRAEGLGGHVVVVAERRVRAPPQPQAPLQGFHAAPRRQARSSTPKHARARSSCHRVFVAAAGSRCFLWTSSRARSPSRLLFWWRQLSQASVGGSDRPTPVQLVVSWGSGVCFWQNEPPNRFVIMTRKQNRSRQIKKKQKIEAAT